MTEQLFIDIQEGFENDNVTIKVNGKVVFKKTQVTTSLLSGPVASFNIPISEETTVVEVAISNRKIKDKITLTTKDKTYLGISIIKDASEGEKIRFIVSTEAFGYL